MHHNGMHHERIDLQKTAKPLSFTFRMQAPMADQGPGMWVCGAVRGEMEKSTVAYYVVGISAALTSKALSSLLRTCAYLLVLSL